MTKAQLACLEGRLETYLRGDTDPTIISLISCEAGSPPVAAAAEGRAAPILNPIIDDKSKREVTDQLIFLTKRQLGCLRENIGRLKALGGQPVVFKFSDCR